MKNLKLIIIYSLCIFISVQATTSTFNLEKMVTIQNPKMDMQEVKDKLHQHTVDFSTKRFGEGKMTFLLDKKTNIHAIKVDEKLYRNMLEEVEEEEFIALMTPQQYLDGLKKCADKETNLGVFTCAVSHTLQMYKDCIQATAATEHIHCW